MLNGFLRYAALGYSPLFDYQVAEMVDALPSWPVPSRSDEPAQLHRSRP